MNARKQKPHVVVLAPAMISLVTLVSLVIPMRTSAQAPPAGAAADTVAPVEVIDAENSDPARNLVVQGVIDSAPTTLLGRLEAVATLLNVREFKLANDFLATALTEEADDEELANVHKKMGSAFFVRLIRTSEVRDAGMKVTRRLLDASDRIASDPQRLAKSIEQCTSDNEELRRPASARLIQIGAPAVPALLDALAKADPVNPIAVEDATAAERRRTNVRRLRSAVTAIGKPAVPVLLGGLYSEQLDLVHQSSQLLMAMKVDGTQSHLAAAGRLQGEAQSELVRSGIDKLLCDSEDVPSPEADEFDEREVWIYDTDTKQLKRRTLTTTLHSALMAKRLASRLYFSQPDDEVHRQLFIGTTLGWAKLEAGVDAELPESVVESLATTTRQITDEELDAALLIACRGRHLPSAIGAAQLLGERGDPALLTSNLYNGLATAIRDPDPRIRFHAAKAIVTMDPRSPYAMAADVANALSFTAAARGRRQVLVVHPQPAQAEYLSGLLRGLRFNVKTVANGREAIRFVRTQPDLEMVLVSELIKRPSWNEITQRLSQDYHSGSLAIAVLCGADRRPVVDGLVARFPRAVSFPTPAGRTEMVTLLRQVMPLRGQFAIQPGQRLSYAASALQAIQPLVQHRNAYSFYEWDAYQSQLVESIAVPQLAVPAARVLGELATPAAQSQLIDFAGQIGKPIAAREAAADAFAKAVDRAGVMLTSDQIAQQYQRYNDNLDDDETAAIFSSLLDTIEKSSREN